MVASSNPSKSDSTGILLLLSCPLMSGECLPALPTQAVPKRIRDYGMERFLAVLF